LRFYSKRDYYSIAKHLKIQEDSKTEVSQELYRHRHNGKGQSVWPFPTA
jgi:hypothetical protein